MMSRFLDPIRLVRMVSEIGGLEKNAQKAYWKDPIQLVWMVNKSPPGSVANVSFTIRTSRMGSDVSHVLRRAHILSTSRQAGWGQHAQHRKA